MVAVAVVVVVVVVAVIAAVQNGDGCSLVKGEGMGKPLMGGPQCHMSILRNGNVACSLVFYLQCHISNLRNNHVPCHYIFSPHVTCHYSLCHMLNLRNTYVALSILGVNGHMGTESSVTAVY